MLDWLDIINQDGISTLAVVAKKQNKAFAQWELHDKSAAYRKSEYLESS